METSEKWADARFCTYYGRLIEVTFCRYFIVSHQVRCHIKIASGNHITYVRLFEKRTLKNVGQENVLEAGTIHLDDNGIIWRS